MSYLFGRIETSFLVCGLLLVVAITACSNGKRHHESIGEVYSYVLLSTGIEDEREHADYWLTLDTRRGIASWGGHAQSRLASCDEDTCFTCFLSDRLSFAVPEGEISVGESWEVEGRSFEAIRTEEFRLLGHALPVVIIAGGRGAADTRNRHYVFSSEFGLLAIFQYKEGGETHSIFLSRSAVGFGR